MIYYTCFYQMSPYILIGLIGFNYFNFHFYRIDIKQLSDATFNSIIIIFVSIFTLLFIVLHILILFNELYNEGYVDTTIDNWKKNPIIDIEINNTNNNNNNDSIGFFKNIKGEKSQNIYKWRNYSFKFTRMEREYNYPKILENKYNKTINKNCGKDNLGNNLYFEGECPINYIEITNNPYPSLKNYENYNWKNISIDNYYLFYTNEYNEGEILIDLKISNNFGPCLKKTK